MTSAGAAIRAARAQSRAALVCYLPAGYPGVDESAELCRVLVDAGADVVEVGLPYSDPVLDGPTIQAAAQAALESGTRIADVLGVVSRVAEVCPTLVMTYWNPVERYGVERFADRLADAGGAGLITPDLIPDEAAEWVAAADARDLDKVFLVAPSSTTERLRRTADACRGFVYATAVMGVTGARSATSDAAPALVGRLREVTDRPVGVGLGVSNGAQAAAVASYADAVIVGSAIVGEVQRASGPADARRAVARLGAELARGVRGEL